MVEERGGWFVKNVSEANWIRSPDFGTRCMFEDPQQPFGELGINIAVIEPGRPACRYHRESAQEAFLVLRGECLLLVNGEERRLGPGDFVHCPPGVSHVFVGAGDGPCAILMAGARPKPHELFYPHDALAARHGAQAPEETGDPRVAYGDCQPRDHGEPRTWSDLLGGA